MVLCTVVLWMVTINLGTKIHGKSCCVYFYVTVEAA